jgi:hypothetical protein
MNSGHLALHLKQNLTAAVRADGNLPIHTLYPGAVGVLVVFDSPTAAREALGSQVKLLEVRWAKNEQPPEG